MRSSRLAIAVIGAGTLLGCSGSSAKPASGPGASFSLQSIAPADPAKFGAVHDYKSWRNPYLIVRADGVGLLDLANNEQHLLKCEELPDALAHLPASAWPYGRVVAVAEDSAKSPADQVLIRKNRGIVAGTLEGLHIVINWVSST
jgi:hypothetical protein